MEETVVRHASEPDLPAITAIYNHYIENTAITFELEPYDWRDRRG